MVNLDNTKALERIAAVVHSGGILAIGTDPVKTEKETGMSMADGAALFFVALIFVWVVWTLYHGPDVEEE